jgi:Fe-S oxidoreductase
LLNLTSKNGHKKIALHDPCFYGRYLELSDVPVNVLASVDIECAQPSEIRGFSPTAAGGRPNPYRPSFPKRWEIGELPSWTNPTIPLSPCAQYV